jgi:hypothetical protein
MTSINCPSCNYANRSVLSANISTIVCRNCGTLLNHRSWQPRTLPAPPDDWSFIQIGTTGEFAGNRFEVIGRVRVQLRNDYKNFWCAWLLNDKHVWLMESFGSIAVLGSEWYRFDDDVRLLHADARISVRNIDVRGEYVEKCEKVFAEGEFGAWALFDSGFFFIQASNKAGNTATFLIDYKDNIEYLMGGKLDIEKLKLENIITWDEWK